MNDYFKIYGKASDALKEARANIAENKTGARRVSFSASNSKMGAVASVSVLPFVTCPAACRETCAGKCYAAKIANIRPAVMSAYARNTAIYFDDAANYFAQIRAYCAGVRFFRWHVSGDIINAEYFAGMIDTARACPWCHFLAFTKRAGIVNDYLNAGGEIPANFQVIFSNWGAVKLENPHNLPYSEIVFTGETPAENWKICGGNCFACACRGVGCWELKHGETIAFAEH